MLNDFRYALRMLRKTPGFTIVSVLTLSLGIGANTAIFSVVNAVLLRPLPYPAPNKIISISDEGSFLRHLAEPTSDPLSWQNQVASFTAAAGYQLGDVNVAGRGGPERLHVAQVTTGFFRVMGVNPVLGGDFSTPAGITPHEIVLSWGLWQRRYGAQPDIVGKPVLVNGRIESSLLALLGGAAGLLLALWSRGLLLAALPTELPSLNAIEIDPAVLAFTVAISLSAALFFGWVPALRATKLDLVSLLKEGSTSMTGQDRTSLGGGLFIAEVALSFVLLTGAGLMVRTLVALLACQSWIQPGTDSDSRRSLTRIEV